MPLGFQQYIAGYTVANLWRYPIRRRVAFANALECSLFDHQMSLQLFLLHTRWFTLFRSVGVSMF